MAGLLHYKGKSGAVNAAKIVSITAGDGPGSAQLVLEGVPDPVQVSIDWVSKYGSLSGGYYLHSEKDGASFMGADEFESAFSPVNPTPERAAEKKTK